MSESNEQQAPLRADKPSSITSRALSGTKGRKSRILFGTALGGILVLGGAFLFFSHKSGSGTANHLGSVPNLPSTQGSKPVNAAYQQALITADHQRAQAAADQQNGSAIPSVIVSQPQLPTTTQQTQPTLKNISPITPFQPTPAFAPPPSGMGTATTAENQNNVSNATQFMANINSKIAPATITRFDTSTPDNQQGQGGVGSSAGFGSGQSTGATNVSSLASQQAAAMAPSQTGPYSAPAAGTILYSQLLGEVNSDNPGPVIATILQGSLTGARLIGSFSTGRDGVVISFKSMSIPYTDENGAQQVQTIKINAVAVDQTHLGDSMATYVNRHILSRIALGFATSFMQGFGQAVASSGSTTIDSGNGTIATTNPSLATKDELYVAGGIAAGTAGSIINQIYSNMPTTIKVAAGTPFGLLFVDSSN